VCDELGARPVVLVGPSLGGGFALEFAAAAPQRVAGLVAIAPAGAAGFAPERWSTPSLLLWGAEDEILAPSVGRGLAQRLADARLELLPGGHACYLQEPERFHALLLEFLAAHAR
jgi:abhydrolase domain-containing protein 14